MNDRYCIGCWLKKKKKKKVTALPCATARNIEFKICPFQDHRSLWRGKGEKGQETSLIRVVLGALFRLSSDSFSSSSSPPLFPSSFPSLLHSFFSSLTSSFPLSSLPLTASSPHVRLFIAVAVDRSSARTTSPFLPPFRARPRPSSVANRPCHPCYRGCSPTGPCA